MNKTDGVVRTRIGNWQVWAFFQILMLNTKNRNTKFSIVHLVSTLTDFDVKYSLPSSNSCWSSLFSSKSVFAIMTAVNQHLCVKLFFIPKQQMYLVWNQINASSELLTFLLLELQLRCYFDRSSGDALDTHWNTGIPRITSAVLFTFAGCQDLN